VPAQLQQAEQLRLVLRHQDCAALMSLQGPTQGLRWTFAEQLNLRLASVVRWALCCREQHIGTRDD
jgi:hypothetical protein